MWRAGEHGRQLSSLVDRTQIPGGMFFVEAEARDTIQQAGNPDRIALLGPSSGSDDASPTVQVLAPPDGSAPLHALVLVSGTAATTAPWFRWTCAQR